MKRRTLILGFVALALVLGNVPTAGAHAPWDVYDRCDLGDTYFYLGGPPQWWWFHNTSQATYGCHPYTRNAQTQTYNYADWYLPTRSCEGVAWPAAGGHNDGRCRDEKKYTGTYTILLYLIREGHFTTRRAPYVRYAFSLARGWTSMHFADQGAAQTGNKYLTQAYFDTRVDDGNAGFMRLIDNTGEPSQTKYVGVERLYYHPSE